MASGKETKEKVAASPKAGMTGGKTNDCEATLRKGNMPKASAVEEAKEVKGAAFECVKKQCGPNDTGAILVRQDRKSYDTGSPDENPKK